SPPCSNSSRGSGRVAFDAGLSRAASAGLLFARCLRSRYQIFGDGTSSTLAAAQRHGRLPFTLFGDLAKVDGDRSVGQGRIYGTGQEGGIVFARERPRADPGGGDGEQALKRGVLLQKLDERQGIGLGW